MASSSLTKVHERLSNQALLKESLPKLIVITGSTGSGKTKLSLDIAEAFNGEIINSDAMQMYEGLDIATAKIKSSEKRNIPHHLFSILGPKDDCSVIEYRSLAISKIQDVISRGKLPIIVGGSLYYIHSILWSSEFSDAVLSTKETEEKTSLKRQRTDLHKELKRLDPEAAQLLHPNNLRKVLRSLKVASEAVPEGGIKHCDKEHSIKPKATKHVPDFDACILWTNCSDLVTLDHRLNNRVDQMMEEGLVSEVEKFASNEIEDSECNYKGVFQAIGYKEFKPYLNSEFSTEHPKILGQCIKNLKTATRRYARKQLRWIKNKLLCRDVPVFHLDTTDTNTWSTLSDNAKQLVNEFLKCEKEKDYHKPLSNVTVKKVPVSMKNYLCVCCQRNFHGDHEWQIHLKTRKHRATRKRLERIRLIHSNKVVIK